METRHKDVNFLFVNTLRGGFATAISLRVRWMYGFLPPMRSLAAAVLAAQNPTLE